MLKFATFKSDIELPFYASLASLKIDHDRLDDSSRRILGLYEVRPTDSPDSSCRLQVHGNALTSDEYAFPKMADFLSPADIIQSAPLLDVTAPKEWSRIWTPSKSIATSTRRQYSLKLGVRYVASSAVVSLRGLTDIQVWDAIKDGTIYSCPSLLASFVVICFADLKKYKFTYLFGFPALLSEPAWHSIASMQEAPETGGPQHADADAGTHLSATESTALVDSVQTWRYRVDARQYGFFLAKRMRESSIETREDSSDQELYSRGTTTEAAPRALDFFWAVGSLSQYETGFFDGTDLSDQFVCFADPSTYKDYPGWMLRNLLVLVRIRWGLSKIQVLCYRDIQSRREDARSLILSLSFNEAAESSSTCDRDVREQAMPRVSGWERSDRGKISSKIASLGEYMDPARYGCCRTIVGSFTLTVLIQTCRPSRRSQPQVDKMENIARIGSGHRQTDQMSSPRRRDTRKLRRTKPDGRFWVPPHRAWQLDRFLCRAGGCVRSPLSITDLCPSRIPFASRYSIFKIVWAEAPKRRIVRPRLFKKFIQVSRRRGSCYQCRWQDTPS